MCIRDYKKQDINDIQLLMKQLGYERPLAEIVLSIAAFLSNDCNKIFLSEEGNRVNGYIALALNSLLVTPFRRCRIENLVIDKKDRRRGIATKLVEYSEKYASRNYVSIMDVTSSMKRAKTGAFDFYRSLGYINDGPEKRNYFRKRLS